MRGCCELGVVQVRKLESDLAAVHEREAEAQTSEPAGNAETAVKAKQHKDEKECIIRHWIINQLQELIVLF